MVKINIRNKTEEFAKSILECNEYKDFIKNSENLNKNAEAQNLLNAFQQKQSELRYNGFSPKIMDELKEMQVMINKNKIIQDFAKYQDTLVELLRKTNNIISMEIGTQFAFSGRSGCCG